MMTQKKTIDVQQIVQDWAEQQYERVATRKMKKLKNKKYISINVDWSKVSFVDRTEWPRLAESPFDDADSNANGPLTEVTRSQAAPDLQSATKASILFQTTFTNNTSENQEYTMRTEKTTRSSCSTNIETGYTKGIDMCVTLKTPGEIFEANAGFHREMSLTNSHGETLEEEVTWGVESHINVKQGHVANAMLIVNEKKYDGNFTIISTMRGAVHVTFNNMKDNNSLVFAASDDVYAIMQDYMETQRNLNDPIDSFVEVRGADVIVKTQGKCNFRFGIKQQVHVEQVPM